MVCTTYIIVCASFTSPVCRKKPFYCIYKITRSLFRPGIASHYSIWLRNLAFFPILITRFSFLSPRSSHSTHYPDMYTRDNIFSCNAQFCFSSFSMCSSVVSENCVGSSNSCTQSRSYTKYRRVPSRHLSIWAIVLSALDTCTYLQCTQPCFVRATMKYVYFLYRL